MDPFGALVPREYENIVLAFAGTRITSRGAQVPPRPATAILAKDRIKNGEVASGAILAYTEMIVLVCRSPCSVGMQLGINSYGWCYHCF